MFDSFLNGNGLSVFTDRPFYHGGSVVNGYVLLNCVKAFDCQQVLLKVQGYEKVSWEEKQEDKKYDNEKEEWHTEERYVPYSGEKDFFKVSVPLQQWPQKCQPGQYQYPFSFVLPLRLPGTFEYKDSQHFYGGTYYNYTNAKVKYKVRAECVVPGILTPNLRGKSSLIVHQTLSKAPSEVQASHSQEVTTCCCSSAGSCSVTASVQKDSYVPGETACVLLQVENKSSAQFSCVDLVLRKRVTLSAGGAIQQLDDEAAKISSPGVDPSTSFTGQDARLLQLALPANLPASTMGQVIQCEYTLIVTLKASTFVSNVELKVPVLIYMPPPQEPVLVQPPAWWTATQPQVYPPMQLEIPSAPPMPPSTQNMGDSQYAPPQPTYGGPSK